MVCGCWHSMWNKRLPHSCWVQHTPLPKNYLCSLKTRYFVRWHYFRCYELFTSIVSERKQKKTERGKGKTKRNFCHRIACKTRVEHNLSNTYLYIYMVWDFLCVSNLQRSKRNCRLMSPSDEGPSFGIWALVRFPSINSVLVRSMISNWYHFKCNLSPRMPYKFSYKFHARNTNW